MGFSFSKPGKAGCSAAASAPRVAPQHVGAQTPGGGRGTEGGRGGCMGRGRPLGAASPSVPAPHSNPSTPKLTQGWALQPRVLSVSPQPCSPVCLAGRENQQQNPNGSKRRIGKKKKKSNKREKSCKSSQTDCLHRGEEKHCSGCAEEQSLYKSKQHSELFELAESTALAFSPALPPLGTRGRAVPHQRSPGDLPPHIYCCSCENLPGEPPMRGAGRCPQHRAPRPEPSC